MKTTFVGIFGLVVIVALAQSADALAVNVIDFPWFAVQPAMPIGIPFGPPGIFLGPMVGIQGVTVDDTFGVIVGTGSCTLARGEACTTAVPAMNPFLGAPTIGVECTITGFGGPWPSGPAAFLVQDVDGNGNLDPGSGSTDVAVGPIFPWTGPVGGATTGAGGPFVPGVPIHVIAAHPGFPLTPVSATLSMFVMCLAM